jgi:hypothetical protein
VAVTACDAIDISGSAIGDISGSAIGGSRARVTTGYTVTYKVETDDALPNPKVVLDYFRTSVGWIGDGFEFGGLRDSRAKCRSIRPTFIKESNNPNIFHVVVEFESILQPRDDIQEYTTQFSVAQEAATFCGAINANQLSPFLKPGKLLPVTNSAGLMHDPQMEEEFDVKVIRITKTVSSFDGNALEAFRGMVNTDEVVIDRPDLKFKEQFGPFYGRLRIVGADLIYNEEDLPQWRQTIEIWINPFGWRRNLLDRGTSTTTWPGEDGTSVGDPTTFSREKDDEGYPITDPVLLDGNGKKLDVAQRKAVYLVWATKPEGAFMPLKGIAW